MHAVPASGLGPGSPYEFLVSTTGCAGDIRRHMGSADYSYAFVLKALAPALEALGTVAPVALPESSLAFRARRAAEAGKRPVHLALHPAQNAYFTPEVPTILFPFWEFPDVPDRDFGHDTRQNWARMGRGAALILAACEFTAEALRRAGLAAPVEVVPVPLADEAFDVPDWDPAWTFRLDCRHFVWGGDAPRFAGPSAEAPPAARVALWKRALRAGYRRGVRRWLNAEAIERISGLRKRVLRLPEEPLPLLPVAPLELSGLVFTSIFNYSDRRKNAEDLLTAFLLAFRNRPDATLVLKLATSPMREFHELRLLRHYYERLGLDHRCRVVVVTDFLADDQLRRLLRATTFYANASRAEGACLPLQSALAAGRPAIAPRHTALADYIDASVALVVRSAPEPTYWPHDPARRLETSWHRLSWMSLRDAFLQAAALAASDRPRYAALSAASRRRMADYAGLPVVTAALRRALRHLDRAGSLRAA